MTSHNTNEYNVAFRCVICYEVGSEESMKPNPCPTCGDKSIIFYHVECLNCAASMGAPICPLCRTKLNANYPGVEARDIFAFVMWLLGAFSTKNRFKLKMSAISNIGSMLIAITNFFTVHPLWRVFYFSTLLITVLSCICIVTDVSVSNKEKTIITMYALLQVMVLCLFIILDFDGGDGRSDRLMIVLLILLIILAMCSIIVKKLQKLLAMYSHTKINVFPT